MPSETTPRCDKCRYWLADRTPAQGECRRFPPRSYTFASDWCGEFAPKAATQTDG